MDGENDMEMLDNFVLCSHFKMIAIVLENAPKKASCLQCSVCLMAGVSHFFIFLTPEPFPHESREICFLWSSCSKTLKDKNRTFRLSD